MSEKEAKRRGRPPKDDAERTGNFSVRMPVDLRRSLEEISNASGRSLNAEIVLRLQQSLDRDALDDPAHLEKLEKRVELAARLEDALHSAQATQDELMESLAIARSGMTLLDEMKLTLTAKMREVDAALKRAKAK